MVTLASPCEGMADREPLTVDPDDLIVDISEQIKDVHYRAAVAVDSRNRPVGLLTRSDLVSPKPRRVILVDHAESAQSVPGVEQAEIVEILDHHHIGSIETRIPVTATFDPVGSTATLITERFIGNEIEPMDTTAILLLCAILSDTVLLNSPTATDRDRAAIDYLEDLIDAERDAARPRDVRQRPPTSPRSRARDRHAGTPRSTSCASGRDDLHRPDRDGRTRRPRAPRGARRAPSPSVRDRNDYALAALMVTDIVEQRTMLVTAGDDGAVERAFGESQRRRPRSSFPA